MRKKSKLVFGVGINDLQSNVYKYETVDGIHGLSWKCPIYEKWTCMLRRCYSKKLHEKRPTYIGCSVVSEWIYFSAFHSWMSSQQWDGLELDKDILFPGNKVYGPDTCVFIPGHLNRLLTDHASARGEYPLGVKWHKTNRKFHAQCCNPFTGKREHLGYFNCAESAHDSWRKRKHQLACMYADMQSDQRIASALRERYA
jgi:hypothetical protein